MTEYGIKISKPGIDAKSGADHEMSLYSKYRNLTIFASGTENGTSVNISHSLGYVPLFLAWAKDVNNKWVPMPGGSYNDFSPGSWHLESFIDTSRLRLETHSSASFDMKYIIFYESLDE